jgi:cytochrome c biogenesis protein
MDGWLRLRAALATRALREAVARYVALAAPADKPEMARSCGHRARVLRCSPASSRPRAAPPLGGLQAIADFLETNVPEPTRAASPRCCCASSTAACSSC